MKPFILSIVRNLLQVFAGVLMGHGVSQHDASLFVDINAEIIVSLVIYAGTQAASFKNIAKIQNLLSKYGLKI